MACISLTGGRALPCRSNSRSGIKAIGVIAFEEGLISGTAGEVSTFPVAITEVHRFEVRNTTNNYVDTLNSDPDTRSISYDGSMTIVLQNLDLDLRNTFVELSKGELIIFIETNKGDILVQGSGFGAMLSAGDLTTGAGGDLNGSNLTFTSSENEPALFLSSAAKASYSAVASV